MSWIEQQLRVIPTEADISLILRHAEREEIPQGTFGNHVPLTELGRASAEELGGMLAGIRSEVRITASPVPRCEATARAILWGGGLAEGITLDWRLGAPGPFVVDEEVCGALFVEIGILEIVRRQLTSKDPPEGMRPTQKA